MIVSQRYRALVEGQNLQDENDLKRCDESLDSESFLGGRGNLGRRRTYAVIGKTPNMMNRKGASSVKGRCFNPDRMKRIILGKEGGITEITGMRNEEERRK